MNKLKLTIVLLFFCLVSFGQRNGTVWYGKFEESSGTTVRNEYDGDDATNNGADLGFTGIYGDCYNYNLSTTDYFEIPDSDDMSFVNGSSDVAFSINIWVYPHSNSTGSGQWLVNKRDAISGGDEWQLYQIAAGNELTIMLFDGVSNTITIDATITGIYIANAWQMFTVTYDGSELETGLKIYKNSVLQSTTNTETGTYTGMNNGTTEVIAGVRGWDRAATTGAFDGLMDEVMIFKNVELNQIQVDLLYVEGNSRLYVWENFINGKINYSDWLNYSLLNTI